jgi:aspartyl/asparaginyl beta-hydroxylase (cupin superfamily)/Tfp pilus assembly protein PilF
LSHLENRIRESLAAAQQALRSGRPAEAERLWRQVLSIAPEHPQALFHLGQHALMQKDLRQAQSLLERALAVAPGQPAFALNLAFVFRAKGDIEAETAALTRALSIDPYFYPALLAKGMLLERIGRTRAASKVYQDVLKIAPPDDQLPPTIKTQIAHAKEVIAAEAAAFETYLAHNLAPLRDRHAASSLSRIDECRDVMLGKTKIYTSQPHMLHFPGLPSVAYYDREDFPWLGRLEAATDLIRAELLALLAEDDPGIRPYLAHPDGVPLNQWAELNRSPRWSAYFLWEGGTRIDAHCARCPATASLVESLPLCDQAGFAPTVNFSILKPHTHLPPHTGDVNTRLIVHLPLIIPEGCRFRVGNHTKPWRVGEAFVFDDTIEHEAFNDSDHLRAILMLDIWHPGLTGPERDFVTALLASERRYREA